MRVEYAGSNTQNSTFYYNVGDAVVTLNIEKVFELKYSLLFTKVDKYYCSKCKMDKCPHITRVIAYRKIKKKKSKLFHL